LLRDPNPVNNYSGAIATYHSYCLSDILQFCVSLDANTSNMHAFDYEIYRAFDTNNASIRF